MSITDIFQINKIKAELEQVRAERDSIRKILTETERLSLFEIKDSIVQLEEKKATITKELDEYRNKANKEAQDIHTELGKKRQSLDKQIADLNAQIAEKKKYLVILDDEILLQSFGFYKPKYGLQNSEQYRLRLEKTRDKQAMMVKDGTAVLCPTNWVVNNDKKEGERMIKDYTKLILRSFNNECDTSISGVKFNNVEAIEKRIQKAYETINNLAKRMSISIVPAYLNLKLEELYLCHEYQIRKQEEREEQKRIKEQMREEAKRLKEIEEMKLKIEKEEKHFDKALQSIQEKLQKVNSEAEQKLLEDEKAIIESKIEEINKNKLDVQNLERNTRAGHVYIISNIGAFGENVYKIGVTRRLDPEERIYELGDASVPFDFDIHALIFSDDAPALENALHKAFDSRRLNLVNARREFFRVTLDEIEQVVKSNFKKPVEFIRLADAQEYRESLMIRDVKQ